MIWSENLCRLCSNVNSNKHSVFELRGAETIEYKIKKCLNISIFKEDCKPKEICNQCLVKLEQFSEFVDICIEVNQRYDSLFTHKETFPVGNSVVSNFIQQKSVIVKNTAENYANDSINMLPLDNLSEDVIQIVENPNLNDGMNTTSRYVQYPSESNTTVLRHSSNVENHQVSNHFYSYHIPYVSEVNETIEFVNKNCTEILLADNQINFEKVDSFVGENNYDKSDKTSLKSEDNLISLQSIRNELDLTQGLPTSKIKTKKKYECPHCNRIFLRRLSLSSHMAIHTKNRPFICSKCGKAYPIKSELTIHKKIHSEQYQCKLCFKSFVVPSKLKRHIRTHTNEKPFKCDYTNCDKTFSDQSNLIEHKETHKDNRNLKCDSCEKFFKTKNQLKSHRLSHRLDVSFTCDICKKSYKYKTNLIFHMKKHTGYVCPFCDLDCVKLSALVKHRKECNKKKG